MQFWTEIFRGDARPPVTLVDCRSLENYCDDIIKLHLTVKDDLLQTMQLALAYEQCKNEILSRKIKNWK